MGWWPDSQTTDENARGPRDPRADFKVFDMTPGRPITPIGCPKIDV
jgi:hypothetical protein